MNSSSLQMRPFLAEDLRLLMAVENAAYELPWSERNFLDCMKSGYDCFMALQEHQAVGHGVMSLGAGEAHILNLCVHPSRQRMGIGRRMLVHLLDRARTAGTETVFLEVRQSNAAARRLYHSEGFNEIGRRRGYYPAPSGREDAVVLALAMLPAMNWAE